MLLISLKPRTQCRFSKLQKSFVLPYSGCRDCNKTVSFTHKSLTDNLTILQKRTTLDSQGQSKVRRKTRFPFLSMIWVRRTCSPRETGSSLLGAGSYFTAYWAIQQQEFCAASYPAPVPGGSLGVRQQFTQQSQEPSNTYQLCNSKLNITGSPTLKRRSQKSVKIYICS